MIELPRLDPVSAHKFYIALIEGDDAMSVDGSLPLSRPFNDPFTKATPPWISCFL